ncbi:hypothetical protein COO60DRAFT_1527800 [Scenedesmus sp. NREL 46B-D3]|nr:hypothetical protein COO60DRAFT_1527800 [Scenedesmus sp. NREL 46B-D3]
MIPMLHSSGRTLLAAVVALFGVQVLCTCNAPGAAGAGCDLGVSRQLVFNPLYMEWCYDAGRRTCWWQRLPKQTLVLVGGVRMSCQVGYACTAVSAGRLVGEAPQQGFDLVAQEARAVPARRAIHAVSLIAVRHVLFSRATCGTRAFTAVDVNSLAAQSCHCSETVIVGW